MVMAFSANGSVLCGFVGADAREKCEAYVRNVGIDPASCVYSTLTIAG